MFHLDVRVAEALDALLEKLESETRLVPRQPVTHRLDEDRIV